ncbi:MAG: hypothetical protein ACD_16C00099G0007 [uncultured bacterium]|nr:MAG: hypothetical protein ACD_16C00099G0007 [uncultured bacterium]OFW68152.1 MAG: hypothetical protein A2X70_05585 [Alphaproteobacteria bacterium GWC2_42_16]OFW73545.1 MAG: hypothetical protein A2Z80_06885 [Alphaproteobacteria bacterium GWA2_41_27]OFW82394.1 MAG: hypothetical protein A3E50_04285 [Alphaproteobacteria bacterium RIFCSPHIGHO2_12_FULL_42_100]OFW86219.1 MAG: hypothetical protein A2W06_01215 [Alphaproteobacteria bacterium RBG_16_42_14]OFW91778.1 MAG: hypothetical protein A3C41_012
MKKVSLLAILATVAGGAAMAVDAAPSNCPKAFQGFHIGGNLGYGVGKGSQKISLLDNTAPHNGDSVSNDLGYNGVDGGVGVGYTHRFCNWAFGIAFDANWASTSGRVRVQDHTSGGVGNPLTLTGKANLKNSLQLYGRAGYVIGQMAMPFVGLGWDNSEWEHKISDSLWGGFTPAFVKTSKKRYNALLWKLGVDFLATKHVVVGFEYTGTSAGKKSFTAVDPRNTTQTYRASFKPQYNKFAITAKLVY